MFDYASQHAPIVVIILGATLAAPTPTACLVAFVDAYNSTAPIINQMLDMGTQCKWCAV